MIIISLGFSDVFSCPTLCDLSYCPTLNKSYTNQYQASLGVHEDQKTVEN